MTRVRERCSETLGTPAAKPAEKARTSVSQVLSQAKTVTHLEIQEVTGPDRPRIAGLGETRLLGVTVAPAQQEAAMAYLPQAVAGKQLAVTLATAEDPERRPLVVVALEDGTPVNARLIQQGLAHPWKTPGPWQSWAATRSFTSNE